MPAPTEDEIRSALRNAFLAAGPEKFAKRDAQGNAVPNELPDALEDIIAAQAKGIYTIWVIWQAKQTTLVPGVTVGGATVVGNLP